MTQINTQIINASGPPGTDAISKSIWHRKDWVAAVALFVVTFGLYARTMHFQFVDYDDEMYVYQNFHITSGLSLANLHSALTATINGNWHPLTTLAWLVLATVSNTSPAAFHFLNVLLHALSASLFFVFLRKATGRLWPSFFAGALWALHPQRVESVAWVSELKDTLCGVMWLGCLLSYLWYSRCRSVRRYLAVAGFLILAMLAKPVAVTLPFVLLLLDYWPLVGDERGNPSPSWMRRVLEKLPLLAISAADVAAEMYSQRISHSMTSPLIYPLSIRIKNAFISYPAYVRDMVRPTHLLPFYPHQAILAGGHISTVAVLAAGAGLLVVSVVLCLSARSRPYLFVGWFWFLGALVPNLGIIQSGDQARADRFTYFPAMGLTLAVVWLAAEIAKSRRAFRYAVCVAAGAVCVVLAVISFQDQDYWQDSPALINHLFEADPGNYLALWMKANLLWSQGKNDEALVLNERSVKIAPRMLANRVGYAFALRTAGRYPEAIAQLNEVVLHDPWSGDAWDCLGTVRDRQAHDAQARHDAAGEQDFRRRAVNNFRNAVAVTPDKVEAGEHLALELAAQGNLDEAIVVWKKVLEKVPTFAQAQGDLADALRLKNDLPGAVEHLQAALAAGSKNPAWESELAYLTATNPTATLAQVTAMVPVAKDAVDQAKGRDAAAQDAYAACLARTNQFELAINAAQQGIADANASQQPAVAAGIQRRLALYERYQPYVAGENDPQGNVSGASSQPATMPVVGPTSLPTSGPATK